MIGRRFAHYRIVEPLASGGMGVVYRARDEHLDRDVAIKVLPPESSERPEDLRRFRREARALSKLNHPHIAVVHDFSEQDGTSFLVMELIEGESLHERLTRGALPESEVRRLGAQIASALEAAHRAGVVHRDLKPANVMIGPGGDAKVLDFGLAYFAAPPGAIGVDLVTTVTSPLTEAGVVVGTLPYMAPEQLLGRPVDARTDIHALGILLHEMATGRLPWRETLPTALIYEIAHVDPAPIRKTSAAVSAGLEAIVARCMQKSPDDRFGTAGEVQSALQSSSSAGVGPVPTRRGGHRPVTDAVDRRPSRARIWWSGAAAGLALLITAITAPHDIWERILPGERTPSLAVLPLVNLASDPTQDYFVDGMTDELINRLTQLAGLRVTARTSVMRYKAADTDLRDIGRELGVKTIVTGSVLWRGDRVRISAQVVRTDSGENIWARTFEGAIEDVLGLQGRVAQAIAERVQARLSARERAGLARETQVDPRVHDAYLRGRYYLDRIFGPESGLAIQYFEDAIRLDPGNARAYAGLAEAYTVMSNVYMPSTEALPRAKAAALQAIERDSTLADAWSALAYVTSFYEWKWDEGGAMFRRALELNPGRAATRRDFGIYLMVTGHLEQAEDQIQQAWGLDPLSALTTTARLYPLYESRRFEEAIQTARGMLLADSNLVSARMILGQSLLMKGRRREALEELRRADRQDGEANSVLRAWLGYALVMNGYEAEARAILRDLESAPANRYVSPVAPAILCAALGDLDDAFRWLERAVAQRYEDVCLVHLDAGMDPLRGDSRFARSLAPLGL